MLNSAFDSTSALAGIFLWILFGYLAKTLNCDLQRLLSNPLILHTIGLLCFLFLFTILDQSASKDATIIGVWIQTVVVYFLFVLMTKSKWYFVLPVLLTLLVDQTLKKSLELKNKRKEDTNGSDTSDKETDEKDIIEVIRYYLNILTIVLICVGAIHYLFVQKYDHRADFSLLKFFIGENKCRMNS